jgi:hypothetical protein
VPLADIGEGFAQCRAGHGIRTLVLVSDE